MTWNDKTLFVVLRLLRYEYIYYIRIYVIFWMLVCEYRAKKSSFKNWRYLQLKILKLILISWHRMLCRYWKSSQRIKEQQNVQQFFVSLFVDFLRFLFNILLLTFDCFFGDRDIHKRNKWKQRTILYVCV